MFIKNKKIIIAFSSLLLASIMISPLSVNASTQLGTYMYSDSMFNSEWELTLDVINVSNNGNLKVGELCFGFDKFMINEDYSWAKSSYYTVKSGVWRHNYDNNYLRGPAKSDGSWSKVEVTHQTNYVSYDVYFPYDDFGIQLNNMRISNNK